eukprot:2634652-Amphidinium_carterae.1
MYPMHVDRQDCRRKVSLHQQTASALHSSPGHVDSNPGMLNTPRSPRNAADTDTRTKVQFTTERLSTKSDLPRLLHAKKHS